MKKKLKDIKVGDTVWVYGSMEEVEKYTVTYIEEFDPQRPYALYHIGYETKNVLRLCPSVW